MKKNTVLVGLLLVVVLLVWLLLNSNSRLDSYKDQINNFDLKNQRFEKIIDDQGKTIIEQNQTILTQKDAIDLNLLEIDRLKKISSQIKYKTVTKIDSVFIPYSDTILVSDTIYHKGSIRVPKRFNLSDQYYLFNGVITLDGIVLDSLHLPNDMRITIGQKRNGIFKKSNPIVEIKNTNPYVETISMSNIIIKKDKKFYDRKVFWSVLGFGLGVLILK